MILLANLGVNTRQPNRKRNCRREAGSLLFGAFARSLHLTIQYCIHHTYYQFSKLNLRCAVQRNKSSRIQTPERVLATYY